MKPDNPSKNSTTPTQPSPEAMRTEYERKLEALLQEIDLRRAVNLEQQAELATLGTHAQQELAELRSRLEAETAAQRSQFETSLAEQRSLFESTLADQHQRFESTIAEQRSQYEARLADQRSQYEAGLTEQHNLFQANLDELNRQMQTRLAEEDAAIIARSAEIAALEGAVNSIRRERDAILNSTSWRLLTRVQRLRERIIPIGSRRERLMRSLLRQGGRAAPAQPQAAPQERPPTPPSSPFTAASEKELETAQAAPAAPTTLEDLPPLPAAPDEFVTPIAVEEVPPPKAPLFHTTSIEIVVRVPQPAAPDAVRSCLSALLEHTPPPYHLTILDRGASPETSAYLAEFVRQYEARSIPKADPSLPQPSCDLLPAIAAPPGTSEWLILLDGTAQVTPGWLERMLTCAQSNPRIGMVGPLTNAPGLQSINLSGSDLAWVGNPLPAGISPHLVSAGLSGTSTRVYPPLPWLEPFCLLLRRSMIEEIGWLDPAAPGQDTAQRAIAAGWQLALADDTYVYVQPTIIPIESRADRSAISGEEDRILQGIRARAAYLLERQELIQRGAASYAGKRILFILPMAAAGGGANAILLAARSLRRMNLEAHIYNLPAYRAAFERAYPGLDVPLVYGEITDLPQVASRYDAVVATSYITVYWAAQVAASHPEIPIAYYIQDYEPYFDEPGSAGYAKAEASYTLLPDLIRGCTTSWIQETIQRQHQVSTTLLGASLDIDLFLPRPRQWPAGEGVRVAAMIRPSTPRRNPRVTMEILQRASQEFGRALEVVIFGASLAELREAGMPLDFPFKLAGRLNPPQVARLMNEIDIFLDYSIFQGLGLSALEAMGCGAATVVPKYGGTNAYACHEENCLVIDTQDDAACYASLKRLLTDAELRRKLGRNGISTIAQFSADLPTFRMLQAIFPG